MSTCFCASTSDDDDNNNLENLWLKMSDHRVYSLSTPHAFEGKAWEACNWKHDPWDKWNHTSVSGAAQPPDSTKNSGQVQSGECRNMVQILDTTDPDQHTEERMALNGKYYSWKEFERWYGNDASQYWREAADVASDGSPQRSPASSSGAAQPADVASDGSPQRSPASGSGAAQPAWSTLPAVTLEQAAVRNSGCKIRPGKGMAHVELKRCREILDGIRGSTLELKNFERPFNFIVYLYNHPYRDEIFSQPVVDKMFWAEVFPEIDPGPGERKRQPRVDFVCMRSDGSAVRIHPHARNEDKVTVGVLQEWRQGISPIYKLDPHHFHQLWQTPEDIPPPPLRAPPH